MKARSATVEKRPATDGRPRRDPGRTARPASPLRDRPPAGGARREARPDRKLDILLAAEKLFAGHGYHGVSIRDVAAEAGVPLALVGYYYGTKSELYEAIFESWRPMMAKRTLGLEAALAESSPARRLDAIVEAFVAPLLDLRQHDEGRWYAHMAARDLSAPTPEVESLQHRYFDPMAHAFIDALCTVSPRASRGRVAWCYQFMLGALLHHMTDQRVERLSNGENVAADPAARGILLDFIGAGFRSVLRVPAP